MGSTLASRWPAYPEAHPDVIVSDPEEMDKAYWKDVHYLKEKVLLQNEQQQMGMRGS